MAKELKAIDVSQIPDLLRIAQDVRDTKQPLVLKRNAEELALITPLKPAPKRLPKGRSTSADDPLWNIVGMADSKGPGDISEKVDEYLAETHLPKD